jgi:hypothetical protein
MRWRCKQLCYCYQCYWLASFSVVMQHHVTRYERYFSRSITVLLKVVMVQKLHV